MPQEALIYRVLVASPSDCAQERKLVSDVVREWNAVHSFATGAIIECVLWETHTFPALGDRPQAIINQQVVNGCDMLIGIFWTRLGTPTGSAESGTAEEIEEIRKAGKPVLLYFSSQPVAPESIDPKEYQRLIAYRQIVQDQGLYCSYHDLAEFRQLVQRHITQQMNDLHRKYRLSDSIVGSSVSLRTQMEMEFLSDMRRIEADWRAERDSDPIGIDEGKLILAELASVVSHMRSSVTENDSKIAAILDTISRESHRLQRHKLFLDGGISVREFWKAGDNIWMKIRKIETTLTS